MQSLQSQWSEFRVIFGHLSSMVLVEQSYLQSVVIIDSPMSNESLVSMEKALTSVQQRLESGELSSELEALSDLYCDLARREQLDPWDELKSSFIVINRDVQNLKDALNHALNVIQQERARLEDFSTAFNRQLTLIKKIDALVTEAKFASNMSIKARGAQIDLARTQILHNEKDVIHLLTLLSALIPDTRNITIDVGDGHKLVDDAMVDFEMLYIDVVQRLNDMIEVEEERLNPYIINFQHGSDLKESKVEDGRSPKSRGLHLLSALSTADSGISSTTTFLQSTPKNTNINVTSRDVTPHSESSIALHENDKENENDSDDEDDDELFEMDDNLLLRQRDACIDELQDKLDRLDALANEEAEEDKESYEGQEKLLVAHCRSIHDLASHYASLVRAHSGEECREVDICHRRLELIVSRGNFDVENNDLKTSSQKELRQRRSSKVALVELWLSKMEELVSNVLTGISDDVKESKDVSSVIASLPMTTLVSRASELKLLRVEHARIERKLGFWLLRPRPDHLGRQEEAGAEEVIRSRWSEKSRQLKVILRQWRQALLNSSSVSSLLSEAKLFLSSKSVRSSAMGKGDLLSKHLSAVLLAIDSLDESDSSDNDFEHEAAWSRLKANVSNASRAVGKRNNRNKDLIKHSTSGPVLSTLDTACSTSHSISRYDDDDDDDVKITHANDVNMVALHEGRSSSLLQRWFKAFLWIQVLFLMLLFLMSTLVPLERNELVCQFGPLSVQPMLSWTNGPPPI